MRAGWTRARIEAAARGKLPARDDSDKNFGRSVLRGSESLGTDSLIFCSIPGGARVLCGKL
jgi:hypothetical protein